MSIGIALLGAGIFASREHLPAIEASDLLSLRAIYSRSQKTAEGLAAKVTKNKDAVDVYYDEPAVSGRGLADLLARDDVTAVAVCLPIALQPQLVKKALAAGKHVISEKPVADTVDVAKGLLKEYRAAAAAQPIWAVAENYRYQSSLLAAKEQLSKIGGDVVSFHLLHSKLVTPDGAYFNTPWRKVPTHPGGFLLDGGVHYVAALRALLSAVAGKNQLSKLSCFSAQLQPILPPVDTLRAVAITEAGASGVMSMSFGTEFGPELEVGVVTTEGSVTWRPDSVTVRARGAAAASVLDFGDRTAYPWSHVSGVKTEFAAFAASIASGKPDPRQSPEEALRDLQVLEAMLESGRQGGAQLDV